MKNQAAPANLFADAIARLAAFDADAARALSAKYLAALEAHDVTAETAKQKYDRFMVEGEEPSPIERLRFFCSIAMTGQDWLDSEPFFDALPTAEHCATIEEAAQVMESAAAHNRAQGRTVLEHTQQGRAERLRVVLEALRSPR